MGTIKSSLLNIARLGIVDSKFQCPQVRGCNALKFLNKERFFGFFCLYICSIDSQTKDEGKNVI